MPQKTIETSGSQIKTYEIVGDWFTQAIYVSQPGDETTESWLKPTLWRTGRIVAELTETTYVAEYWSLLGGLDEQIFDTQPQRMILSLAELTRGIVRLYDTEQQAIAGWAQMERELGHEQTWEQTMAAYRKSSLLSTVEELTKTREMTKAQVQQKLGIASPQARVEEYETAGV